MRSLESAAAKAAGTNATASTVNPAYRSLSSCAAAVRGTPSIFLQGAAIAADSAKAIAAAISARAIAAAINAGAIATAKP